MEVPKDLGKKAVALHGTSGLTSMTSQKIKQRDLEECNCNGDDDRRPVDISSKW